MLVHLMEMLYNTPLLIEQSRLCQIFMALGDRIGFDVDKNDMWTKSANMQKFAINPNRGKNIESNSEIAVIPILGSLIGRNINAFPESGLTSHESIRNNFQEAMGNPTISQIIFDIHSGGGSAEGAFATSDLIYQARGGKPITAFINEQAYSAAYLIASAADRIFMPAMGGVGSIGVIMDHVDISKLEEKEGIHHEAIYSGARKNDFSSHAPLSTDARAIAQKRVDEVYALFVDTVSRNRNIETKNIYDLDSGVLYGQDAIKYKLADKIIDQNKILEEITIPTGGKKMSFFGRRKEDVASLESLEVEIGERDKKIIALNVKIQELETSHKAQLDAKVKELTESFAAQMKDQKDVIKGFLAMSKDASIEPVNLAEIIDRAKSLTEEELNLETAARSKAYTIQSTLDQNGDGNKKPAIIRDADKRAEVAKRGKR
jgi:signal peptide peptidase SppA